MTDPAGNSPVPQSAAAVRATLAALGLTPHKRFGQNFLVDPGTFERIIREAEIAPGDVVLEVGPGLGGLTERLLRAGADVVAAEIDRGLCRHLRNVFGTAEHFTLVLGDVLLGHEGIAPPVLDAIRARQSARGQTSYRVVSNLPYSISSPFLVGLLAPPGPPRRTVVMLQREVADVLAASPGAEDYSALSVVARIFLSVRRAFDVPPDRFFPRPEVDSSVVVLEPRSTPPVPYRPFLAFVRLLFQQRRKALRSSLRRLGIPDAAEAESLLLLAGLRPEDRVDGVDPAALVRLFERLPPAVVAGMAPTS